MSSQTIGAAPIDSVKRPIVGILGYQGCIAPHEAILKTLGVETRRVRTAEELAVVDRLIIPGGESTTMLTCIERAGTAPALAEFAQTKPVWGICAGAILLAQKVVNPAQPSLNAIDITAHRNFYGSQVESFIADVELCTGAISAAPTPVSASFIRAPHLAAGEHTPGRPPITVAGRLGEQPVFFTQGRIWACSFHVELGSDATLHQRFITA